MKSENIDLSKVDSAAARTVSDSEHPLTKEELLTIGIQEIEQLIIHQSKYDEIQKSFNKISQYLRESRATRTETVNRILTFAVLHKYNDLRSVLNLHRDNGCKVKDLLSELIKTKDDLYLYSDIFKVSDMLENFITRNITSHLLPEMLALCYKKNNDTKILFNLIDSKENIILLKEVLELNGVKESFLIEEINHPYFDEILSLYTESFQKRLSSSKSHNISSAKTSVGFDSEGSEITLSDASTRQEKDFIMYADKIFIINLISQMMIHNKNSENIKNLFFLYTQIDEDSVRESSSNNINYELFHLSMKHDYLYEDSILDFYLQQIDFKMPNLLRSCYMNGNFSLSKINGLLNLLINKNSLIENAEFRKSNLNQFLAIIFDRYDIDMIDLEPMAKLLLSEGANINYIKDREYGVEGVYGGTYLIDAVKAGLESRVNFLLINKADTSIADFSGKLAKDYVNGNGNLLLFLESPDKAEYLLMTSAGKSQRPEFKLNATEFFADLTDCLDVNKRDYWPPFTESTQNIKKRHQVTDQSQNKRQRTDDEDFTLPFIAGIADFLDEEEPSVLWSLGSEEDDDFSAFEQTIAMAIGHMDKDYGRATPDQCKENENASRSPL